MEVTVMGGLQPLPKDARDFLLAGVFDAEAPPLFDFTISTPIAIKNQEQTDLCTAYATTSVSEDQEGVELSPHYQFAATKHITGTPDEWGADLRSACKSLVAHGSLPSMVLPRSSYSRAESADWEMWKGYERHAAAYGKSTYFSLDGNGDLFDTIRGALWSHRHSNRTVVTGMKWRREWTNAEGGIIPIEYGDSGFGHAFKFYGQRIINGTIYLSAQLSNGTDIGDNGIFYFPREVVNKECTYGNYMLTDLTRKEAEYLMERGKKYPRSIIGRLWLSLLSKI